MSKLWIFSCSNNHFFSNRNHWFYRYSENFCRRIVCFCIGDDFAKDFWTSSSVPTSIRIRSCIGFVINLWRSNFHHHWIRNFCASETASSTVLARCTLGPGMPYVSMRISISFSWKSISALFWEKRRTSSGEGEDDSLPFELHYERVLLLPFRIFPHSIKGIHCTFWKRMSLEKMSAKYFPSLNTFSSHKSAEHRFIGILMRKCGCERRLVWLRSWLVSRASRGGYQYHHSQKRIHRMTITACGSISNNINRISQRCCFRKSFR